MKEIGQLLQERKKETIKIIPKKEVISLISGMVCFHKDPLTNWRIVATRLKTASIQDASKIFYSIRLGTYLDSTDIKGAFLYMCKKLRVEKKPKQSKLFK
jgi:hypothetical protein